jgi:hypothetical protein
MSEIRTSPAAVADPLTFSVEEVTGMRSLHVENVDGHRTAEDVATSMASMLELPSNTPYALRDEERARMLIDDRPIGSQVPQTGAHLVCIPKSHLG